MSQPSNPLHILITSISYYVLCQITNAHHSTMRMWFLPDSIKVITVGVLDLAVVATGLFAIAETVARLGLAIALLPTNAFIALYSRKLACTCLTCEWYGVMFSALQIPIACRTLYQLSTLTAPPAAPSL